MLFTESLSWLGEKYIIVVSGTVGFHRIPQSLKELLECLDSVAHGIDEIHTLGFFHRDIRWPNILKSFHGYFLNDYEMCCLKLNSKKWGNRILSPDYYPEGYEYGNSWEAKHDFYQYISLLEFFARFKNVVFDIEYQLEVQGRLELLAGNDGFFYNLRKDCLENKFNKAVEVFEAIKTQLSTSIVSKKQEF